MQSMQSMQVVREEKLDDLIEPLIRQKGQVTITHQTPRGWRMFRSSLIAGSAASRLITVKPVAVEIMDSGSYPSAGDQLTVTFRRGHKKCTFASIVTRVEQDGKYAAVQVHWPEFASQLQRRLCERVSPPSHQVIPVRIWSGAKRTTGKDELRIVRNGQIEDLSVGGIRVKVPLADEFEIDATYCCAFTPHRGDPAVVVDTLLRHREATEQGRACLGFQIVGLESSTAGRQTLEIIAKTVQRFHRLRVRSRE